MSTVAARSTRSRVFRNLSHIFFVAGMLFAYIGPREIGIADLIAALLFQLYAMDSK
jgi:Zn-dependent membrane protease YugP